MILIFSSAVFAQENDAVFKIWHDRGEVARQDLIKVAKPAVERRKVEDAELCRMILDVTFARFAIEPQKVFVKQGKMRIARMTFNVEKDVSGGATVEVLYDAGTVSGYGVTELGKGYVVSFKEKKGLVVSGRGCTFLLPYAQPQDGSVVSKPST